jgi:glyoxylase-like metal-dependent hydrolase (beta-lactamase superfamily II)
VGLEVPGSPRVLFTQGHTLGHCALHLPERDVAISADALVTYVPYTDPADPGRRAGRLLTDARRPARTTPDGSLVPLAEQDREL